MDPTRTHQGCHESIYFTMLWGAGASVADSGIELDERFLHSGSEGFSDGDLDGVRGIDARHGAWDSPSDRGATPKHRVVIIITRAGWRSCRGQ